MTTVVHCKRSPYDIYIGRPSIWGNPFAIGRDGTRKEVIAKYREYILSQPTLLAQIPNLKDKVLGCWCSPQSCHGDVLADLADNGIKLSYAATLNRIEEVVASLIYHGRHFSPLRDQVVIKKSIEALSKLIRG